MENATKALLIAAAILIAIILITLALAVIRQGQDAVQTVDMTEAEKMAFNSKFLMYERERVSGKEVNTLIKIVAQHNKSSSNRVVMKGYGFFNGELIEIIDYVDGRRKNI